MARLLLLFALCFLPALATAFRPYRNPFVLQGRVYCDTCRAGFETPASTYISGAGVRVECKNRRTMELVYSQEARTDSTGTYKIWINEDHEDQLCDTLLVYSPLRDCSEVSLGRHRTRVILTRYNGIASDNRVANNMGFLRNQPLSTCSQIMKLYQDDDN